MKPGLFTCRLDTTHQPIKLELGSGLRFCDSRSFAAQALQKCFAEISNVLGVAEPSVIDLTGFRATKHLECLRYLPCVYRVVWNLRF